MRTIGLKFAHLAVVIFLVSSAAFLMVDLIPGDVAATIGGPEATTDRYQQIRAELGLDRSLLDRYVHWVGDALTGDFGRALLPPGSNVSDMLTQRVPVTAEITFVAMLIALFVAIPVALIAANRPGSVFDRCTTAGAFGVVSVPGFLFGLALSFLFVFNRETARWIVVLCGFAVLVRVCGSPLSTIAARSPGGPRMHHALRWVTIAVAGAVGLLGLFTWFPTFPRQGFARVSGEGGIPANLRSVFLPALTVGLGEAAVWARVLRTDLIHTLGQDFVVEASARGLPQWHVLLRHALRPSSFSLIAVMGVSISRMIGGSIVVERIFNLPGLGTMMVDAINGKDVPVVQAGVLVIAVFLVVLNSVIDFSYRYIDPRLRRGSV